MKAKIAITHFHVHLCCHPSVTAKLWIKGNPIGTTVSLSYANYIKMRL